MIKSLEVSTATYVPEIDQSQHVRSVSHLIIRDTIGNKSSLTQSFIKTWKRS